jgi:hypothetical protein
MNWSREVTKTLEETMKRLMTNELKLGEGWELILMEDLTLMDEEAEMILKFSQIVGLLKALMDDPSLNKDLVELLVQTFIHEKKEECSKNGKEGEEGKEDDGVSEEEGRAFKKQRV